MIVTREMLLEKGSKTILWLLAGPETWEKTPRPYLRPESIGDAALIALQHPESLETTWADSQRTAALSLIVMLHKDLVKWAEENNRPDMLLTVGELVKEAVQNSE